MDLIAKTTVHVGEAIREELDLIESIATRAIEALNATINKEKVNP